MTSPTILEKPITPKAKQAESTVIDDQQRRRDIARLLKTTIFLVALNLLVCEFVCRFIVFLGKPPSSQNPIYDAKYLVATTVNEGNDNVVLCGDSLMKQGMYPELITSRLSKVNERIRVVNLATTGGSQKDAICYLEFLRNRHIKPRLVVFDFEVCSTGCSTAMGNQEQGQSNSYLFNAMLSRPKGALSSIGIFLSDCSYLVRQRGNIKHFLLDFLGAVPNPQLFQRKTFFDLCDVDDFVTSHAGMSPDHKLTSSKDWSEQQRRISTFYKYSPKSGHFEYNPAPCSIIIKYCQDHEIPLVLAWLPHQSRVYRAFWYQAPYTEAFFRQKFEDYGKQPFVFPLYLNTLPEDCAYYADYRHLSTCGCIKASELMADALTQPKYLPLIKHLRPAVEPRHK